MRILLAAHKERGVRCLEALLGAGHAVVGVVAHHDAAGRANAVTAAAERLGLPLLRPADVNAPEAVAALAALEPEVTVLAGYGQIVRAGVLGVAPRGCVNLHGGRLPDYRGSSPMNWALMNGDPEVTVCVIAVDLGVDTGDVLGERVLPVGPDETIAELQERANAVFPELLVEVLGRLEAGTLQPRRQDPDAGAYWPLRFPDDGLLLWDRLTAAEVHDRVRALTDPYPGAFTVHDGRRVRILRSRLEPRTVHGEPGRVYRALPDGLLVCAADRCLWITRATFEDGADALPAVPRYARFATAATAVLAGVTS